MPDLPAYNKIQKRAYELWEKSGKPLGYDMEFWARAERELRDQFAKQEDEFAAIVTDIASRAARMPAAEREGYIALSLALFRSIYEVKFGAPAPEVDTSLAEQLRKRTDEAVAKLGAEADERAAS